MKQSHDFFLYSQKLGAARQMLGCRGWGQENLWTLFLIHAGVFQSPSLCCVLVPSQMATLSLKAEGLAGSPSILRAPSLHPLAC